jgi:adenosylhomocysteine nucleosidase
MICYAFPLAHEAKLLLSQCTEKESFSIGTLHCTLANFRKRHILVTLIGMGETTAAENSQAIFEHFAIKAFVLAGYGGALVAPLKVGQVVVANNFTSDAILGFLRMLSGFDFASFCMADEVAGTVEKREFYARQTGSQVIDMETEAVAAVVSGQQIPFLAIRVISDDYHQVLPLGALAAGFDPVQGRATPMRLLAYLAGHPREISPLKKFVTGLSVARKNLTSFLAQLNDELPPTW